MNIDNVKKEFPIFDEKIQNNDLVYLDSANSSQKPKVVIDRISNFYETEFSNVGRSVHTLAVKATNSFEATRDKVQKYLNANHREEIIFTKGATEAINLVASSYGKKYINKGDEVIISAMEHHSNIVPWQMMCERKECTLRVVPIDENGDLILEEFEKLLNNRTKLVAVSHISNSLGTINPVKTIIDKAHAVGAKVLIDGAQSIQHMKVDMLELDCDFYAFSGHKVFGPTGVGILYGKKVILDNMPPYQGGGDMIAKVTFEKTTYNELPHKFEAGTPNISGGIGLGAAIKYFSELDIEAIHSHEQELAGYTESKLMEFTGMKIIGTAKEKTSVVSFVVDGIHPFDLGTLLDKQGIAVRTGHHCTQPIMDFFEIPGTIRASFAFYNTMEEIDIFIAAVERSLNMLR